MTYRKISNEKIQFALDNFLSRTKIRDFGRFTYPYEKIEIIDDCIKRYDSWLKKFKGRIYAFSIEPLSFNGITCHILNVLIVSEHLKDLPFMFRDLGNNQYRVFAMTFNAEIPEFDEMGFITIKIDESGSWSRIG